MISNVFIINLTKRKDRLLSVMQQFNKYGIDVNVWKAVDGKNLKIRRDSPKKNQYNAQGILGCMLSHYTLIKHAKESDLEYILFLKMILFYVIISMTG